MQATYVYDVVGNRIEKDVWTQSSGTTTVTRYGLDGQNVWADLTGSNSLQTRYLIGNQVDQFLAREVNGAAAWYLTDRLGSVRAITDNSGVVQDTIGYDAFGNITSESNPTYGGTIKYTGRATDSETGFQFDRARYYNPLTGTWTSQDPIGLSATDPNLYRYVQNSPTNYTDPTGLDKIDLKILESCKIALYYVNEGLFSDDPPVFLGLMDPDTMLVKRAANQVVPFYYIYKEVHGWGTTSNWNEWFKANSINVIDPTVINLGIKEGLYPQDFLNQLAEGKDQAKELAEVAMWHYATAATAVTPLFLPKTRYGHVFRNAPGHVCPASQLGKNYVFDQGLRDRLARRLVRDLAAHGHPLH